MEIFPNPAIKQIEREGNWQIKTITVDIQDWAAGVDLIQVVDNSGELKIGKPNVW